jgi:hypothetical protein
MNAIKSGKIQAHIYEKKKPLFFFYQQQHTTIGSMEMETGNLKLIYDTLTYFLRSTAAILNFAA